MSTGMTRSERLRRLEELYFVRAFSDIEMANHLKKEQGWNVDRTTIYRDRTQMEAELGIPFVEEVLGEGRWKIDRTKYISNIRLNPNEALSLYLAARRATQQTRIAQRYAASALERLAIALRQPMSEQLVKAADTILAQKVDSDRLKIFEEIAKAWIEGRPLNLTYRGLEADESKKHRFHTYLIEPATWSDSVYVIGYSELFGKVTPLKLERIERASISAGELIKPDMFDEQTMLAHAWGVWNSGRKPITVKLRFTAGPAAKRLGESIWHPLEKVEEEIVGGKPTGNSIWQAEIAEPREMIPFIRSWGADCEIIEPEWLRRDLKETVQDLMSLYQIEKVTEAAETTTPPHLYLWAKANKKTKEIHRLIYHMIDVGQAALALWQEALNDNLKWRISKWLNLSPENAGRLIAFWASLHDLGKASPAFQDHPRLDKKLRVRIRRKLITAELLSESSTITDVLRHELITAWALQEQGKRGLFASQSGMNERTGAMIASMLGGHHGAWPRPGALDADQLPLDAIGGLDAKWNQVRVELFHSIKEIFHPPVFEQLNLDRQEDENMLLTLLSAIVSIADWLGSDEEFFKFKDKDVELAEYAELANARAYRAVHRYNWLLKPMLFGKADFFKLFERSPRLLQEAVIQSVVGVNSPALIIIEAPTGIGKTELAFYIADQWLQQGTQNGMYIAMPTTATSNQMHDRATKFIRTRYGHEVAPLLVHSQALLKEEEIKTVSEDSAENDLNNNDRAADLSWFLPRKRSLLATFGVGTVDQTLMSVLQTKHFFVRLMGLHQKVVIFDEVHAYDVYMLTIFKRLLAWLRELNASVIILSATLADQTRRELAAAYLTKPVSEIEPAPKAYPRLTIAQLGNQSCDIIDLNPKPDDNPLFIELIGSSPQEIRDYLQNELVNVAEGGCVAVICNTIDRAQKLYEFLDQTNLVPQGNLILFHARYPYIWRKAVEDDVLSKFGPPDNESVKRPGKAIVVATQVIEQSLDLDFDLMISDLAPIDLLIQRAGRLHRHQRGNRVLPYRLILAMPEVKNGLPVLGKIASIYDRYTMLKTWITLRELPAATMSLPSDTPTLIEKVYGDEPLTSMTTQEENAIRKARDKQEDDEADDIEDAENRLVLPPADPDLIWGENLGLEEDNPKVLDAFRAMTRKDGPGIALVCLHQSGKQLLIDPDDPATVVNPYHPKTKHEIHLLLKAVVNVRHYSIIQHFLAAEHQPATWKRIPALRYHRLVIFQAEVYPPNSTKGDWQMELTRKFGLKILTEQKEERGDE